MCRNADKRVLNVFKLIFGKLVVNHVSRHDKEE
uniref:Uncharacterized protein n=1 Tax=Siphoviridae sp. ctpbe1 TaxID=2826466 RepID=A0A8S5NNR9_9CAUD|nr:MAG TPA: hypothetical protein [Siphoviridae sp. ctpbe1]